MRDGEAEGVFSRSTTRACCGEKPTCGGMEGRSGRWSWYKGEKETEDETWTDVLLMDHPRRPAGPAVSMPPMYLFSVVATPHLERRHQNTPILEVATLKIGSLPVGIGTFDGM